MGKHDEARKSVTAAAERVRMRASRICEAKLRAGFLANVWENARTLDLETKWAMMPA
jgi:hypothetical protein